LNKDEGMVTPLEEKKEYQKPELIEYENLNAITGGTRPSGD
jgi:hypothetical protein